MKVLEKRISYTRPQRFQIYPFGDIHAGSIDCAEDKVKKQIDIIQHGKDAYWIGMGDMIEAITESDPRWNTMGIAPWVERDNIIESQRHWIVNLLKPIANKCIAYLTGNHEESVHRHQNCDISRNICNDLEMPYAGYSCFVELIFERKSSTESHKFTIHAWHGAGAAQTEGAQLLRLKRLVKDNEADVFCVDEETEILTKDGWRRHSTLLETDIPITFNLITNEIQEDKLLDVVYIKSEGYAYKIKGDGKDQMLHPKHRVIYKYYEPKYRHDWLTQPVEVLSQYKAQIDLPMAGHSSRPYPVRDNHIRLTAWLISEGSFRKYPNRGITISQQEGKKADIIRALLLEENIKFSEYHQTDYINFYIWMEGADWIKQSLISGKNIPDWVMRLDDRQFRLFIDEYMLGDGHANPTGSGQIYSKDETLVDRFQIACLKHGYRTHKYYKQGGFKDGGWCLTICPRDTVSVALTLRPPLLVPYDGIFWGIATGNTTIICRRNGYVFITGNCMGHLHSIVHDITDRLCVRNHKVKKVPQIATITGSWKKSYGAEYISWEETKGFRPSHIGCPIIIFEPQSGDIIFQSSI